MRALPPCHVSPHELSDSAINDTTHRVPNPLLSKTYLSDGWHAMNIWVLAPAPDIYESWCGD